MWTQEANAELAKYMRSKSFFLNITGSTTRRVGNEAIQTFYTLTKDPKANSKAISKADLEWLLSKKPNELTFDVLSMMFGKLVDDSNRKSRGIPAFKPTDKFKATFNVNGKMETYDTTVGRYVFYKTTIERSGLSKVIPYTNYVLTDGAFSKIENVISEALLNDKIAIEEMVKWINYRDWLGLQLHAVITTSFSPTIIRTPKEVRDLKKQLIAKHKEELEAGNPRASEEIEKALVNKAKEVFKDDYGLDLYQSGARGSIGNNMKNMQLFRGAIKNPATGKYDIIESSLMDGMEKVDFTASSNSIVTGAYPKSIATADSGYLAKEILAALQTEKLDVAGSDCGTKGFLKIAITKKNSKDFLYRYIIAPNGKLITLTPENIESYVGKSVKMRSPMMCIGEKICNHCAGDLYYKLGIENAGLTASRVATTLTRLNINFFVFVYRNVYLKTSLMAGNFQ